MGNEEQPVAAGGAGGNDLLDLMGPSV